MVPKGWRLMKIGQLVEETKEVCGPSYHLPVFSVTKDRGVVLQSEKFKKRIASSDTSKYRRLPKGHFAYDPMSLYYGAIGWQRLCEEGIVSPAYITFRALDLVEPHFLWMLFKSAGLQSEFVRNTYGGNLDGKRKKTDWRSFCGIEVPLPDLYEQRAIVERLSAIDAAIEKTNAVIEQTKRLKQGLLQELLTRGIGHTKFKMTEIGKIPESWTMKPLAELGEVRSGVAKGKKQIRDPVELPYLRVANVQDGHLALSEIKTIIVSRSDVVRYSLQTGDVLLTEGGDIDKLGRGCVWNGEIELCLHQNHVFAVRCDSSALNPKFLSLLASSAYGKRYFLSCAKQTTNLASINSSQLRAFPVLLPKMKEQECIVEYVSGLESALTQAEYELATLHRMKSQVAGDLLRGHIRVLREVQ
ncbi:MAG: restriction endonuclease subunit S [Deltaproteobacteria bacterium]|nr:restriction endonuclease subunit S [Deltaproteobacteria bacterium]